MNETTESLLSDDLIQRVQTVQAAVLVHTYDSCEECLAKRLAVRNTGVQPLTHSKVDRVSWDDYFFRIAQEVSTRATCPRAAIGTVLVDKHHRIVATGYNGSPPGEVHCLDVGCMVYANHCTRSTHAESNAVQSAWDVLSALVRTDQIGLRMDRGFLAHLDITPYLYGPRDVCAGCARVMAWAGISREPQVRFA